VAARGDSSFSPATCHSAASAPDSPRSVSIAQNLKSIPREVNGLRPKGGSRRLTQRDRARLGRRDREDHRPAWQERSPRAIAVQVVSLDLAREEARPLDHRRASRPASPPPTPPGRGLWRPSPRAGARAREAQARSCQEVRGKAGAAIEASRLSWRRRHVPVLPKSSQDAPREHLTRPWRERYPREEKFLQLQSREETADRDQANGIEVSGCVPHHEFFSKDEDKDVREETQTREARHFLSRPHAPRLADTNDDQTARPTGRGGRHDLAGARFGQSSCQRTRPGGRPVRN